MLGKLGYEFRAPCFLEQERPGFTKKKSDKNLKYMYA